jgi:Zn-dependent protease with chaperone function
MAAVLAHEVSHIRNGDLTAILLAQGIPRSCWVTA